MAQKKQITNYGSTLKTIVEGVCYFADLLRQRYVKGISFPEENIDSRVSFEKVDYLEETEDEGSKVLFQYKIRGLEYKILSKGTRTFEVHRTLKKEEKHDTDSIDLYVQSDLTQVQQGINEKEQGMTTSELNSRELRFNILNPYDYQLSGQQT